jgi:hypothetical protein
MCTPRVEPGSVAVPATRAVMSSTLTVWKGWRNEVTAVTATIAGMGYLVPGLGRGPGEKRLVNGDPADRR